MEHKITDYLTIESVQLMYSYGIAVEVNDGSSVTTIYDKEV